MTVPSSDRTTVRMLETTIMMMIINIYIALLFGVTLYSRNIYQLSHTPETIYFYFYLLIGWGWDERYTDKLSEYP